MSFSLRRLQLCDRGFVVVGARGGDAEIDLLQLRLRGGLFRRLSVDGLRGRFGSLGFLFVGLNHDRVRRRRAEQSEGRIVLDGRSAWKRRRTAAAQ